MKRIFIRALLVGAVLVVMVPLAAAAQTVPASKFDPAESWAQFKKQAKDAWPNFVEDTKLRLKRMRIVRRPKTVLTAYEADPDLWKNLSAFYDFITKRELDVWEEQEGMLGYFPDRAAYYDFLDTMIPAMRERKFERNRLLKWAVHEITPLPDEEGQPKKVKVVMSMTSDDTYPIGKTMVYSQTWIQSPTAWYPGKVDADVATWWERLR